MAEGKSKKSGKTKSTEPDPSLYYGKGGSFTLPNGDTYEGDYCAHRIGLIWREGHGTYRTHDGQTYEGEWKDDKLIENRELIIKYPNGAEYHGCLSKNKYKGPGTYILECKMDLSCNFEGNKPAGTVILVDYEGKLWFGEAKQDKAILLPENIFYLNLSEENGKGYPLDEQTASLKSIEEGNGGEEASELTDREWEAIIFKRSSKTENDVDFNDSRWVRKFERFCKRKEDVLGKLDEGESLTDEEQLWIEKFERYQAKRKKKEEENAMLKEKASEEAMMLIEKFRSPEFNDSCPGVSVIYPSPHLREGIAKEESEDRIPGEESDDDLFEDACIQEEDREKMFGSNVTIVSYYGFECTGNFKSERFNNLFKLKKYVKQLEFPVSKPHFTEEREKRRAEMSKKLAQMKEEAASTAKLLTKASKVQGEDANKGKKKDSGKKSKEPSEVSTVKKKESTTSKMAVDEKTALQERIKKYVEGHFEAKDKLRAEEKSEIILPKRLAHTHNIAVCTEPIDGDRKSLSNSFDSVKS